jgi:hypothetical protein
MEGIKMIRLSYSRTDSTEKATENVTTSQALVRVMSEFIRSGGYMLVCEPDQIVFELTPKTEKPPSHPYSYRLLIEGNVGELQTLYENLYQVCGGKIPGALTFDQMMNLPSVSPDGKLIWHKVPQ